MSATSVSAPCSNNDVTHCLEMCCVPGDVAVPRACVTCSFLCWRDDDVRKTCDSFCHFAFQSGDHSSHSGDSDSDRSLEIVVFVLGVLVVALTATTAFVMVRWCRHSQRKRMTRRKTEGAVCAKNKCKGLTTAVSAPSTVVELLPVLEATGEKITDTEAAKTVTSALTVPPAMYHRLDMDAGSVCETLTDDEFHDVWTPGTSPPPSPLPRLICMSDT